jgi:predicted component of type VI protein secretion system
MNIFINKRILLMILALVLTACERSRPSDSVVKNVEDVQDAEDIQDAENIQVEEPQLTKDLLAPEGMAFISYEVVNLKLDLSQQGENLAFLSIYSDYKENSGQWYIDYDSRLVASSIQASLTDHSFSLPGHLEKLLIQVWFYDVDKQPLTQEVVIKQEIDVTF